MQFGLVPDALDAGQRLLEAALLRTLAAGHPGLPELQAPDSVWGLSGASPVPEGLALWPAAGCAGELLVRWLPTRTADGEPGGVPGLRARPVPARRRDTLSLAVAGERPHVELRCAPAELAAAARLAAGAGLEVLWEPDAASRTEAHGWRELAAALDEDEAELWSRGVRRLGAARSVFARWKVRPPRAGELLGGKPEKIAPRQSGRATALKGVVAVVSGDGRGGRGCTTAAYLLAAAAATGGARVAFVAGNDDPSNLPALLGLGRGAGWRDAGRQLPTEGVLQVALRPADASSAAAQLTAARARCDLVVVDADAAGPRRPDALDGADVVVAIVPDRVPWYTKEAVDDRSARPQIWDHLSAQQARRPRQRDLPAFLDDAFERYALWRTQEELVSLPGGDDRAGEDNGEDGPDGFDEDFLADDEDDSEDDFDDGDPDSVDWDYDPAGPWVEPYNPADPEDADRFWEGYRLPGGEEYELPGEQEYGLPGKFVPGNAEPVLPAETDAAYLPGWRQDFLEILAPEGERRHGERWRRAASGWSARNRARNTARLAAGALTGPEQALAEQELVRELAADGIERWGAAVWDRESAAWAAAGPAEREQVAHCESDLLWVRRVPRPAPDVAAELRQMIWQVPAGRPAVMVVNRLQDEVGGHVLADVSLALREQHEVAGLEVIGRRRSLEVWAGAPRLKTQALAVGWSLAAVVAGAVAREPR